MFLIGYYIDRTERSVVPEPQTVWIRYRIGDRWQIRRNRIPLSRSAVHFAAACRRHTPSVGIIRIIPVYRDVFIFNMEVYRLSAGPVGLVKNIGLIIRGAVSGFVISEEGGKVKVKKDPERLLMLIGKISGKSRILRILPDRVLHILAYIYGLFVSRSAFLRRYGDRLIGTFLMLQDPEGRAFIGDPKHGLKKARMRFRRFGLIRGILAGELLFCLNGKSGRPEKIKSNFLKLPTGKSGGLIIVSCHFGNFFHITAPLLVNENIERIVIVVNPRMIPFYAHLVSAFRKIKLIPTGPYSRLKPLLKKELLDGAAVILMIDFAGKKGLRIPFGPPPYDLTVTLPLSAASLHLETGAPIYCAIAVPRKNIFPYDGMHTSRVIFRGPFIFDGNSLPPNKRERYGYIISKLFRNFLPYILRNPEYWQELPCLTSGRTEFVIETGKVYFDGNKPADIIAVRQEILRKYGDSVYIPPFYRSRRSRADVAPGYTDKIVHIPAEIRRMFPRIGTPVILNGFMVLYRIRKNRSNPPRLYIRWLHSAFFRGNKGAE